MDKNQLIEKIQSAQITPELKAELLGIVSAASEVNKDLVSQIVVKLDQDSAEAFGALAQIGLDAAQEENDKDIAELEVQGSGFVDQVNKTLDEQGMEDARRVIKGN